MLKEKIDNSPVRSVKGKVELYDSSTKLATFTYRDRLKSFTVERYGEDSKFFGFGICQKINIKLIDKDRELDITTDNFFRAYLTTEGEDKYCSPFPIFYVSEVHRDENTNELSITAYDALYGAGDKLFDGIDIATALVNGEEIDLMYYAYYAALQLGMEIIWEDVGFGVPIPFFPVNFVGMGDDDVLSTIMLPDGANVEGSESVKDILDDIAEATLSIYYISNKDIIVFKRLDRDGEAALSITKSDYIKLDSKTNRRLAAIYSVSELGENVGDPAVKIGDSLTISGTTQNIKDNIFWSKAEDVGMLVNEALAALGGITINQFECSWRGNYLLEPGDKIEMTTKDNEVVVSYLLNDSIEYNGFLSEKSQWKFEGSEDETHTNSTTLGEALKQTYARVDKANKEINLHASEIGANGERVSQIDIAIGEINTSVSSLQTFQEEATGEIETLQKSVETKITDEEVSIKINSALENGVGRVETTTGFTFDDVGLTVSKDDTEMKTTITEDGMIVYKDNTEMLIANKDGVEARNLEAKKYLIIDDLCRFEKYGSGIGCFWIGG